MRNTVCMRRKVRETHLWNELIHEDDNANSTNKPT